MTAAAAAHRGPVGDFRNIALIRLSSVGDVIMALPTLEGLRRTYPDARISWIVERRARNILEDHPAIDEIIEFPRDDWRALWKKRFGVMRSVPGICRFYRDLHRRRFDLTLDFQGNLKSATCTLASRARVRVGYAKEECREPNHYFTNRRLSLAHQAVHRIERDLLLAGLVGVPMEFVQPRIAYAAADRAVGEELVSEPGTGRPIVLLHPGTSNFMPHKRWPLASYAALADRLVRERAARVLLSWGPGELEMAQELAGLMEEAAEVIPPTPTVKSLGFLLSRVDLVIGGDTGPTHLAVVQGIATLGIMGPSDPRHYYPLGHPERVFYRRLPCSPCRNRSCAQLTCLHDIPVEDVAREALRALPVNPSASRPAAPRSTP